MAVLSKLMWVFAAMGGGEGRRWYNKMNVNLLMSQFINLIFSEIFQYSNIDDFVTLELTNCVPFLTLC